MKTFNLVHTLANGWDHRTFETVDPNKCVLFVFGSSEYKDQPKVFSDLQERFPGATIVGCSTAGEIMGGHINDQSLAIGGVEFKNTKTVAVSASVASAEDSFRAGQELGRQLAAPDLRGVILFSDGLKVNGSSLARGINGSVDKTVTVTGGLAGDGARFQQTWTLRDGMPHNGVVTALGLYGSAVQIAHGSKGGWDIFGPERRITKSIGNVVYEIDGKPALSLYKTYLGEMAAGLPATALLFPLKITASGDQVDLVRTILNIDPNNESLTFAGDVPEGAIAQLMRANFDRLVEGAFDAALMAKGANVATPMLCLAISCVGRRLILKDRAEDEVEATLAALPKGTQQVGFYSYGEISPVVAGDSCALHNQTMTITTIKEAA